MGYINVRKLCALPALVLFAPMANALDFIADDIPYVQYGDGHSYSLPISQLIDEQTLGGSTGPGSDYYVASSPGQIDDLIVLGTGASGQPVTTNFEGMDGAYATPNSSGENFFSTPEATDPDDNNDNSIVHDYEQTWDASLSAMQTFLDGEEILFFFNNNQEKSEGTASESLAVWAQVWITVEGEGGDPDDPSDDVIVGVVYEITNDGYTNTGQNPYALVSEGGGGAISLLGGDATLYDSGITDPLNTNPEGALDGSTTDYILSGGAICLDTDLGYLPVSCANAAADEGPIDHNLGANEVAYAISLPELNLQLAGLFGSLTDEELSAYTLHVDFRFGCDPALYPGSVQGDEICSGGIHGKNINNGYEQLFIGTTESISNVPAPATLALFGLGLLGLGAMRKKVAIS